jgi:hypothetical protein
MLSENDNKLLTEVGRGTPMGSLLSVLLAAGVRPG